MKRPLPTLFLVLAAGAVSLTGSLSRARATPGNFDPSFAVGTGPNNNVNAVALQEDGKIVIAGAFTTVDGVDRAFAARLSADGTLDATFQNPPILAGGEIYAVAVQPDGKILLAGIASRTAPSFTSLRVFRLNADGSFDESFSTMTDFAVIHAVVLQPDGRIIVGGDFKTINNLAANSVARLNADGSLDHSFNPGSGIDSGSVYTLALQADGKVLVGGSYRSFNGVKSAGYARLNADGSLDETLGSSASNFGFVRAFATLANGSFYLEQFGTFERDTPAGETDDAFAGEFTGDSILSIALGTDLKPIIAGDFTSYGDDSAARIARLNTNGSLDRTFVTGTGANGSVHAVAVQPDARIVIAGAFTTYNGTPSNYVTRLLGGDVPVVTSTLSPHVQIGQPFTYQITTAAGNVTGYTADGLPKGLTINAATGKITGTPLGAGTFHVTLGVVNASGKGSARLDLTVFALPTVSFELPGTGGAKSTVVAEGGAPVTVFVTRAARDLSRPLIVKYKIKGANQPGVDYQALSGTATIPAKASNFEIQVRALDDGVTDGNKILKLKLSPSTDDSYLVGTPAQLKIRIIDTNH